MAKRLVPWIKHTVLILIGTVLGLDFLAYLFAEGLWFDILGYRTVFLTQIGVRAGLCFFTLFATATVLCGNLWITQRSRYQAPVPDAQRKGGGIGFVALLSLLFAIAMGLAGLVRYQAQIVLQYWHPTALAERLSVPPFNLQTLVLTVQTWLTTPWELAAAVLFITVLLLRSDFVLWAIALAFSLAMGLVMSNQWGTVLSALNATPFGSSDPIFQRDIGFYIFQLPLWELGRFWLIIVGLTSLLGSLLLYIKSADSLNQGYFPGFTPAQQRHLAGIGSGTMLAIALGFWLDRYQLLYSTQGIIYGAGFTDTIVSLPVHTALSGLSLITTFILLWRAIMGIRVKTRWQLWLWLGLYGVSVALGWIILPLLVQLLVVQPNELSREQPYIIQNIRMTRQGFDLESIETKTFNPTNDLTPASLKNNDLTIRNIRLWDTRPLLDANRQLQRIRLYYEFPDADIDRYPIATANSEETAEKRQVLVAARELDYDAVPDEAKTWINQRLIYTHGYGFTMSPVNTAATSGLPEYFIKNIGTSADDGGLEASSEAVQASIPTQNPRIYFGEITDHYVLTGTKEKELDYPSGNDNVYNQYNGNGGVSLDKFGRRGLFALYLRDWRMLLTQNITPQTQVLFRRQIQQRVRAVAPFLKFDSEPYLIAAGADDPNVGNSQGDCYWMIDAYTVSDRYPYSDPGRQPYNYIRNSVKVVVNAYSGAVQLYSIDPQEPILATWRKIFPDLFQPLAAMPDSLRSHIRYPTDLFRAQSESLLTYHMTDPQVFYNREDQWRVPNEIYGESEQRVEPYYLITKLPEAETEEFILLYPFTPVRRNNLIAWLAARSDGDNYGKRLLYQFPKRELVFGA